MKIADPKIAAAFAAVPPPARARLMALREMIFEVAKKAGAGEPEESLKWGEPAYRPPSGSTVRLGWKPSSPNDVAIYFICTTGLIDSFRELYPRSFRYGGNRAIHLPISGRFQEKALRHCLALALTYHRK